jgi:AcrR family transcriptional regulator
MKSKTNTVPHDDMFFTILEKALELDLTKGHLKWNISELAREAGITRTLIYYYFSSNKEEILEEAIVLFGAEIMKLDWERVRGMVEGDYEKLFIPARNLIKKVPPIFPFYAIHRTKDNRLGERIRKMENDYQNYIKLCFPLRGKAFHEGLYALSFGLTFDPGLSDEGLKEILKYIFGNLKRDRMIGLSSFLSFFNRRTDSSHSL